MALEGNRGEISTIWGGAHALDTTLLVVKALAAPPLLVEIEAVAAD